MESMVGLIRLAAQKRIAMRASQLAVLKMLRRNF